MIDGGAGVKPCSIVKDVATTLGLVTCSAASSSSGFNGCCTGRSVSVDFLCRRVCRKRTSLCVSSDLELRAANSIAAPPAEALLADIAGEWALRGMRAQMAS